MIPKVEACLETLQKGVRKIHIIDGRMRHSLLLEIYTNRRDGLGNREDSSIVGQQIRLAESRAMKRAGSSSTPRWRILCDCKQQL